ncbi:hypothetical protein SAMN05216198_3779 [Halopseudomonas litoralis]|uniref:Uncharacterized protein n=1 Tax=Halopseudomonas litoralis TaxID=797277 RepID=A0A1H1XXU3_9GAMM|nr:hypothetical protein SAMN05216198_3779 [Halopseudomonas litoralis]
MRHPGQPGAGRISVADGRALLVAHAPRMYLYGFSRQVTQALHSNCSTIGNRRHLRLRNRMPSTGSLYAPQHRSAFTPFNPITLLVQPTQIMHGIGVLLLRSQIEPVRGQISTILLKKHQCQITLRLAIAAVRRQEQRQPIRSPPPENEESVTQSRGAISAKATITLPRSSIP